MSMDTLQPDFLFFLHYCGADDSFLLYKAGNSHSRWYSYSIEAESRLATLLWKQERRTHPALPSRSAYGLLSQKSCQNWLY
jgi:hypothetical protein